MGWVHRTADQHRHDYPHEIEQYTSQPKPSVGDRWECSCGDVFIVKDVRSHGDQRDGYWWTLQWDLYTFANPVQR
jgi:hypothetical protein